MDSKKKDAWRSWKSQVKKAPPPANQTPKLKLSLITSTWLHLIISNIFTILHHSYCCYVYIPCTTCLHIPLAHPCLYYYLLSLQYPAHFILLHFFIFSIFFIFYLYLYIFSWVCVTIIALSIEQTWPDLHFTTDYILYNWV